MDRRFVRLIATVAALGASATGWAAPRVSEAERERAEADDATLRRQATDEWYNETSTRGRSHRALVGQFSEK
jgi:hypothetical protein